MHPVKCTEKSIQAECPSGYKTAGLFFINDLAVIEASESKGDVQETRTAADGPMLMERSSRHGSG
jgi:hypothetical protein